MKLSMISRYPVTAPRTTPLLFVHGSFTDARCWDYNFLPFFARQGYEAHALSLRGHGLSEGHEHLHGWRLADYVADLVTAVASFPNPPVLIGHSMGGMVVQKYLERHACVAGVALMASVPPQGLLSANLHMAMHHPFLFQQMTLFALFGSSYGSLDMMQRMLFSSEVPRAKLEGYLDLAQAESQRVALDMLWFDPLRLNPDEVRVPILVLGAADDVFISESMVRDTARFYRTQARIFPGMAHAMMLEMNWREAADQVLNWVESTIETHSRAQAATTTSLAGAHGSG